MGTLEEKKNLQRNSGIGIVLSFGLIGLMIMTRSAMPAAGAILGLGSLICWITGLCLYAKSKGYAAIVGLLGILTILGLLLLVVLKDQWQYVESQGGSPGPGPGPSPIAGDPKVKVPVRQYRW